MNALIIVLTVIDAMVALLLIGVVLIQQSKDGGLGGSAFGGAGGSVFGGQAADHLAKITVALSSIFLILTLSLAIITGRRTTDERLVDENAPTEMTATPSVEKLDVQKEDKDIIDTIDGAKDTKTVLPANKSVKTPTVPTKPAKINKPIEEPTAPAVPNEK